MSTVLDEPDDWGDGDEAGHVQHPPADWMQGCTEGVMHGAWSSGLGDQDEERMESGDEAGLPQQMKMACEHLLVIHTG